MSAIPNAANVLVLYGDVPLIRAETLQRLPRASTPIAVLVTDLANPAGYGHIVHNSEGKVAAIIEDKDADEEQRRIHTVNTGILCAESTALRRWLSKLSNTNMQGEYCLTDIFASATADLTPANMIMVTDPREVEGVDDLWQLTNWNAPGKYALHVPCACKAHAWPIQQDWTNEAQYASDRMSTSISTLC